MPYLVLIYAVIIIAVAVDIVVADGRTVRGLPKMVWVLGAMVLPLLGPIAWFALGRPSKDDTEDGERGRPAGQTGKPTVAPARSAADEARAAEEFRRAVRERAQAQRRAARDHGGPDA
ncbi:PLD nuclease N-terminal domain-containing protein [Williamsia sp. M5A3_1d]